ncbi:helix-turn-helix transcriptional regulator [Methylobacterium sp. sgz302541]|uniref:helix-turn-helix transcriptional regulator n=1 Tax=unclassified Methylobacterium TaxID=2615210 RepID=UPI003D3402CE
MPQPTLDPLPRYLRVRQIVAPHGVLPISRSTFYAQVAAGTFPPGTKLTPGTVVWPTAVILALAEKPAP